MAVVASCSAADSYPCASSGDTVSATAGLEKSPWRCSGGKAVAGFEPSPRRSRIVESYSGCVSRRSGVAPGEGTLSIAHAASVIAEPLPIPLEPPLAPPPPTPLPREPPPSPIDPIHAAIASPAPSTFTGTSHGRMRRTITKSKPIHPRSSSLKGYFDPRSLCRKVPTGIHRHAIWRAPCGPESQHASDAMRIDRNLVDPRFEHLCARLIFLPSDPDLVEVGEQIRVLRRAAVLHAGVGGERRVRHGIPPERGLVGVALVHPLDAEPPVERNGNGSALGIVVRVRPVARAAVGLVVGSNAEEVLAVLQLPAHPDLSGDAGAARRDHRP